MLALPAILIAIAILLPFLKGAYRIDDPYFLLLARHARAEPLDPQNFNMCWFSYSSYACGPASQMAPGAVLMGYFLLPVTWLGYNEAVVHLMQLVLLCLAIWVTVALALDLSLSDQQARLAGLLVATMPIVVWSANTALPDLLAMTLGVYGIERLVRWIQRPTIVTGMCAAIALGLAPFARAHLFMLLGVGALAVVHLARRNKLHYKLRGFGPVLGALVIFGMVTVLTRHSGANGMLPPSNNLGLVYVIPNLIAFGLYCVFPFPIALAWTVVKRPFTFRRSLLVIVVSAGILWDLLVNSPAHLLLAFLGVLGCICMAQIVLAARRSRQWKILVLSIWLLIPLAALPYRQLPLKYLLASAPAVAILIPLWLQKERGRVRNSVLLASIAGGLTLSILILRADTRFAELPREAAAELIAPRVNRGKTVWFTGEWGLYWYAQLAGARVLIPDVSKPRAGDVIVIGDVESQNGVIEKFPRRALIEERTFSWTGGRVMSQKGAAGLYWTGKLPWSWGSGKVNRYQVWRVE